MLPTTAGACAYTLIKCLFSTCINVLQCHFTCTAFGQRGNPTVSRCVRRWPGSVRCWTSRSPVCLRPDSWKARAPEVWKIYGFYTSTVRPWPLLFYNFNNRRRVFRLWIKNLRYNNGQYRYFNSFCMSNYVLFFFSFFLSRNDKNPAIWDFHENRYVESEEKKKKCLNVIMDPRVFFFFEEKFVLRTPTIEFSHCNTKIEYIFFSRFPRSVVRTRIFFVFFNFRIFYGQRNQYSATRRIICIILYKRYNIFNIRQTINKTRTIL